MKVLSKKRLKRIFMGKNKTALENVMQEIAIMKKLVNFIKFISLIEPRECGETLRSS